MGITTNKIFFVSTVEIKEIYEKKREEKNVYVSNEPKLYNSFSNLIFFSKKKRYIFEKNGCNVATSKTH